MAVNANFLKEKEDYQRLIPEHLRDDNGCQIRDAKTAFNPGLAMDPELLFSFLRGTQEAALEKPEKTYKEKTQTTVLNFINNEINKKNRGLLDVLQNYVTYEVYYRINKIIEDDPELNTITAKRKIANYVTLHDTNISQKIEIIVEHYSQGDSPNRPLWFS